MKKETDNAYLLWAVRKVESGKYQTLNHLHCQCQGVNANHYREICIDNLLHTVLKTRFCQGVARGLGKEHDTAVCNGYGTCRPTIYGHHSRFSINNYHK